MKILVEIFFENMLINFVTLRSVSIVLHEQGKLFWLSSIVGASLNVFLVFFDVERLGTVLFTIGSSLWLLCICFQFKTVRKFVKIYSAHVLSIILYGGTSYFVANYLGFNFRFAVLCGIVGTFYVVRLVCKSVHRKRRINNFCYDVEIRSMERKIVCQAFLDSGNFLTDPVTNEPVSLISLSLFEKLYGDKLSLCDVICKTEKIKFLQHPHYIQLKTLSGENNILAFNVDELIFDGVSNKKITLGLALKDFNGALGSEMILNNHFAEIKEGL